MIRALLKTIVILLVLVVAGVFLLGWWGGRVRPVDEPRTAVGTTGEAPKINPPDIDLPKVDTQKAREVASEVGEKTAVAADRAGRAIADGSLTTKIKAKMALDDSVKAMNIDVDTKDGIVTLRGAVQSEPQRQRALQLARETHGVSQVVDKLQIKQ